MTELAEPKGLISYFVVSGLHNASGIEPDQFAEDSCMVAPLSRTYKAHILCRVPQECPGCSFDEGAVSMLCHPRGLQFCTDSSSAPPHTVIFHPFLIVREDGSRQHGAALTFYETVTDANICKAMATLQAMHLAEQNPASYDTSSSDYYNPKSDTLYATKCISVISPLPYVHLQEAFLRLLYESIISIKAEVSVESHIYNILYNVTLPCPGHSISFTLPGGGPHMTCQRPGELELPLCDYSLRLMFELLGVESVLSIFTSVLLEHQILLYSNDLSRLMLVCEGMTTLMYPFSWPHVYVPILPAAITHFLDAPVPYIMGLHHATEETIQQHCSKAGLCFVNIDTGQIELPEDLPEFPYRKQLAEDLIQWLSEPRAKPQNTGVIHGFGSSQRDSGFRDSFLDDSSSETSKSGSLWSLPNKMEVLQQSEALAQITALAKKTGVISSLDEISDSLRAASMGGVHHRNHPQVDSHTEELIFNNGVREIFLHFFVEVLCHYQNFVIHPRPECSMDDWINNRDQNLGFDKFAFLGDQPEAHLAFLAAFVETQMFTTLIDNKILAQWQEMEPNLKCFEERIRRVCEDSGERRVRAYSRGGVTAEGESRIIKRHVTATVVELTSHPHPSGNSSTPGRFPTLDTDWLNTPPPKLRCSAVVQRTKKRERPQSEFINRTKEELRRRLQHHKLGDLNVGSAKSNTNWKFVETLLSEAKTKTKRILVEKMGSEAFELGHRESIHLGVEENTLIASLCDLLERIWSHGQQSKQGKSALWWHLRKFKEHEHNQQNATGGQQSSNQQALVKPDLRDISGVGSSSAGAGDGGSGSASEDDCPSGMQTWPIRHRRSKPSRERELPTLKPLPVSLVQDMRHIEQTTRLKTDVGCARAWVRLALEKKLLSTHLKELLSNNTLTKSLYKRYSLLRCEEEREQLLFHLLSLNAVDFHCFTNTFTDCKLTYRVLIFPAQKSGGATSTANCWLSLAGDLRETSRVPVPKASLDLTTTHVNLGRLTTMRLGHDNAGISPKWMVEHVLVRNQVTGQMYRFPCGRWLGKGVDDGALERLLIAEPVPYSADTTDLSDRCRTPPRCRSPSTPRRHEPKLGISAVQEMLCDSVNNLVKHFCRPEKERGSVTSLLCGEYGLVYSMECVFQSGFKSSRLWGKRFIWDFLEKVYEYFELLISDTEHYEIRGEVRNVIDSYRDVVARIMAAPDSVGKDGRFQMFVCVGVRDHMLPRWIKLLSKTPVCTSMYEEKCFLREPKLVQYVVQLLDSLTEFTIPLENTLIKDISL